MSAKQKKQLKTRDEIQRGLEQKGFEIARNKNDHFAYLLIDGKRTNVFCKAGGHSTKKYNEDMTRLFRRSAKAIGFDNECLPSNWIQDFLRCDFSREDYLEAIQNHGLLAE